jgi:hypothetical protein
VDELIVKTLETTPKDATHWSTRSMGPRCRALAVGGLADLAGVSGCGSAFTAHKFRQVLSGIGIRRRRVGYRDPASQAFIEGWFAKLRNAASGGMSSRPLTRQGS